MDNVDYLHEVRKLMTQIEALGYVTVKGLKYQILYEDDHDEVEMYESFVRYVLLRDGRRHTLEFYFIEIPYQFDGVFLNEEHIKLSDVTI